VKGTWKTTSGGGGGGGGGVLVVLGLVAALIVARSAVRVAEAIPWWLWAAVPVLAVAVIGAVAAVIVHVWRAEAATYAARMSGRQELPEPAQRRVTARPDAPALPPIEQHIHHHWHTVSAADVAAILARNHKEN